MTRIKEYLCDGRTPTDDELRECLWIAAESDCIVKLRWFFPYNGWHEMYIDKTMTFAECKEKLPKRYGV
jgi:hypothetical protein